MGVSGSSFDELLTSADRPILVDFWADWCGSCHALAPTLQEIAKAYAGRLHVVKVNVDERPKIAAQYHIQSIPTMILFDRGQPTWRASGALPFASIARELDARLAQPA
jgi:thioredoxin